MAEKQTHELVLFRDARCLVLSLFYKLQPHLQVSSHLDPAKFWVSLSTAQIDKEKTGECARHSTCPLGGATGLCNGIIKISGLTTLREFVPVDQSNIDSQYQVVKT